MPTRRTDRHTSPEKSLVIYSGPHPPSAHASSDILSADHTNKNCSAENMIAPENILGLTLLLTREVARLHGVVASLREVMEEVVLLDPRLDKIDAAQIQIDELQKFYSWLEGIDPEIAALIDNRSERMFDKLGDSTKKFMDEGTGL